MKRQRLPLISFILPTFNAQRYLRKCINSILALDYPKDKFEILVADGGSKDSTLEIVSSYKDSNIKIIKNHKRIAEDGKYLAYKKSKGEFLVLIDSDNVIASRNWLKKLLLPLLEEKGILGTESNYLVANDFTSINTYATLLVIVDPVARMLASKPEKIEKKKEYDVKLFSRGDAPVAGANGFIWRKEIIKKYLQGEQLNEANLLWKIAQNDTVKIANVPGVGIYHYYCDSLGDYIKKRQKIAKKFLDRQSKQDTWVDSRNSSSALFLSAVYLATIVGPSSEALVNAIKHKSVSWLWHPLISFSTTLIYFYYFFLNKMETGVNV